MARYLSLQKKEVRLLARALNEAKLSIFSPADHNALPDLARKLAGFLLDGDGSSAQTYKKKPKQSYIKAPDCVNKAGVFAVIRDVGPLPTASIVDDTI